MRLLLAIVAVAFALVSVAWGDYERGSDEGAAWPSKAGGAGSQPRVACWNKYFPFEPEPPQFRLAPRKCLIYRDGAETYAEGSVLGQSLRWKVRPSRARALGKLDEPKNDRTAPHRGRLVLSRPVNSCGRRVFSRVEYRIRTPRRTIRARFPIYTC